MRNLHSSILTAAKCLVLLSGVFVFLNGCSYPAKSINMIPESYDIVQKHNKYVQVVVTGEKANKIGPVGDFPISNEEVKKALEAAINKSGIFSGCVENGDADYLLEINIGDLTAGDLDIVADYVQMIFSMKWALTDNKTNKTVWKDMIVTTHETPISAEFNGNKRLRMTNEGAVRDNITRGISEISRIDL